MKTFFNDVMIEFRKVVWTKKEAAINATALVIGLSIFVGIYVSVFDLIVMKVLRMLSGV